MAYKNFPKIIIIGLFFLGLISATAFRVIIVINRFDPFLGRIVWYIGVIGYIFFFGYRFHVALRRRLTISKNNLIEKVKKDELSEENKKQIEYLLSSIMKSKEMFNYIYIFVLSGLAIIIDIILTLAEK